MPTWKQILVHLIILAIFYAVYVNLGFEVFVVFAASSIVSQLIISSSVKKPKAPVKAVYATAKRKIRI